MPMPRRTCTARSARTEFREGSATMPSASTILIAGASRGLGAALAAGFLGRGWNVIGTARAGSGTALHDLAEKYPGRVRIEALDIDESGQIAALRERLAGSVL